MKKLIASIWELWTKRTWCSLDTKMIESWSKMRQLYKERGRL